MLQTPLYSVHLLIGLLIKQDIKKTDFLEAIISIVNGGGGFH